MSYVVELLDKARYELFESWKWYEEKEEGLGHRFEEAVYRKLYLIAGSPLHYPLKAGKYREAQVEDFPFIIVFKTDERRNLIIVYTLFHTSRHPRRKM